MKQLLFYFVMGLCGFILVACGYKSEVTPLTDVLEIYTAKSVDDGSILMGVREKATEKTIIQPDRYLSISADEDVIICKNSENVLVVYTMGGKRIGYFDMFTHWKNNGNYYLGTIYNNSCFYFPETEEIVDAQNVYVGLMHLFLQVDGRWIACRYNGKTVAEMPAECALIKELKPKQEEEYYFVVEDDAGNALYYLYTLDHKKVKTFSVSQWKQKQKKLKFRQRVDKMDIFEGSYIADL